MQRNLYTLGYEGFTLDNFLKRLTQVGIETVVDVRANPISRKRGFSKRGLAAALECAGLNYRHEAAMGCPKPVRDRYKLDESWDIYTDGFLSHLSAQSKALASIADVATRSRSCLICFEADFNRCHRMFVARAVAQSGSFIVTHLTAQTEIVETVVRSAA